MRTNVRLAPRSPAELPFREGRGPVAGPAWSKRSVANGPPQFRYISFRRNGIDDLVIRGIQWGKRHHSAEDKN
jgi:hypothetical protein